MHKTTPDCHTGIGAALLTRFFEKPESLLRRLRHGLDCAGPGNQQFRTRVAFRKIGMIEPIEFPGVRD